MRRLIEARLADLPVPGRGGTLARWQVRADAVHEAFLEWDGQTWDRIAALRADDYRLDLLRRSLGRPPADLLAAEAKT